MSEEEEQVQVEGKGVAPCVGSALVCGVRYSQPVLAFSRRCDLRFTVRKYVRKTSAPSYLSLAGSRTSGAGLRMRNVVMC